MSVRKYDTRYGPIYVSTPGKVGTYDNMRTYKQANGNIIYLQGPAMRAFKAAEEKFTRPRIKRKGRIEHIRITGHGWRSYELQRSLWLSDKNRYAHPDDSFHVEALAVDLDQSQPRLAAAREALASCGWKWGAAFGDVPHHSFHLLG